MLFSQDIFLTFLLLERKRCERSGDRFGLALLDVSHLTDTVGLQKALCSKLRATDIVGWYTDRSVIGIIFTILNGTPIPQLRSMLRSKIDDALNAMPVRDDIGNVRASVRIFPEDTDEELYPDLRANRTSSSFYAMKRIIDIAVSLMTLVILSPLFLIVGILVKISSPGPVLFKQERIGLFGRSFEFLKFRTMVVRNDPCIHKDYVKKLIQGQLGTKETYKLTDDPRITRVGRILRRLSLDELPQFINVLKGEMSLVGPRPPIRYEMENYLCWHRRRVFEAKPGLTGLWQVRGRSRTTFDEMVRMDIRYIEDQCGWLDFKIVLQTPRAVLSGAGAY
jgi:lipopolysaccharide/colanic/teichoic acid biosynthesis glycosyltransferase